MVRLICVSVVLLNAIFNHISLISWWSLTCVRHVGGFLRVLWFPGYSIDAPCAINYIITFFSTSPFFIGVPVTSKGDYVLWCLKPLSTIFQLIRVVKLGKHDVWATHLPFTEM
jgi:hypothetical protein